MASKSLNWGCSPFQMAFSWLINEDYQLLTKWDDPQEVPQFWIFRFPDYRNSVWWSSGLQLEVLSTAFSGCFWGWVSPYAGVMYLHFRYLKFSMTSGALKETNLWIMRYTLSQTNLCCWMFFVVPQSSIFQKEHNWCPKSQVRCSISWILIYCWLQLLW